MGPFVGGHSYRPLNANRVICRSMGISDVSRWTNDALINAAHNLVCGENAAYHFNHSGQVLIIICGSVRNCGDIYMYIFCLFSNERCRMYFCDSDETEPQISIGRLIAKSIKHIIKKTH